MIRAYIVYTDIIRVKINKAKLKYIQNNKKFNISYSNTPLLLQYTLYLKTLYHAALLISLMTFT